MNLYALKTKNRFNQYLIFTSKAAVLAWGRANTTLKDIEILALTQKLTFSGDHFNLFAGGC